MILHTLNASPTSAAFRDCLRHIGPGDALLLLGDGVYAAIDGTEACGALRDSEAVIHLLASHAQAAGVVPQPGWIITVDMAGFVALTERFERQMAWY